MNWKLWQALLITHFGGNASRAWQAVCVRLSLTAFGAAAMGFVLSQSLATANLPHDLPPLWLAAAITLASFVVGSFTLFAIGASRQTLRRGDTLSLLAVTWPLSQFARWLLAVLPSIIILALVAFFAIPLALGLAHGFSVSVWLLPLAVLAGLAASLGFVLANVLPPVIKTVVFMGLSTLGVAGLEYYTHTTETIGTVILAGFAAVTILCSAGLYQRYRSTETAGFAVSTSSSRLRLPKGMQKYGWFYLKLLRNRRTLGSFVICAIFSTSTAAILAIKHSPLAGNSGWLLFGALLGTAFACDIRGITRRDRAPEIYTLKGRAYFLLCQIGSSLMLAIVMSLPLLAVVFNASPTYTVLEEYIGVELFGVVAGLAASTMFVPQTGELGSQFFAALLAAAAVLSLPKIGSFSTLTTFQQLLFWLAATVGCVYVIYIIELRRSNHYGHT